MMLARLTVLRNQTRLGLMKVVNIQAAKTHLSRLVEEAAAGQEIVIAKAGRPYVKLVSCLPSTTARKLGGWEGKVEIAADFDDTTPELLELFEGGPPKGDEPSKTTKRPARRRHP